MNPRPSLKLSPERRLVMTFALRQALEILQMPQLELGRWLAEEIEKNPLFDLKSAPQKRFEVEVPAPITLHEHLHQQIRENFPLEEERAIAEKFVEALDERGFLACSVESIAMSVKKPVEQILSVLQTFDPPGIFARDLRETLLLQLKAKGKEKTLAYLLVQTSFEDLLHGRYQLVKKRLGTPDLGAAIQELARLSLRPASAFQQEAPSFIYPDLRIGKIGTAWTLELNEDEFPKFEIEEKYLELEPETGEEREALRGFKTQAKWILRSLNRRRKLLRAIGKCLIRKQAPYLDRKGPLRSFTMKELSEKLGIHESTLSRALSGKYASTPRGIIPLRSLMTAAPEALTARGILEELVQNEDKEKPLTDDQLATELKAKGYPIARRTIAKYRIQLKIGSATQRKHHSKKR